ncbi:MAG TPA: hypothetical protein VN704_08315, partial [Verrucomicrobiae bacterium]|nr:hypothetical protein [Verrucomicrobiae bacterium]
MEHKITFYNLGNADTSLIELKTGKKILLDYANEKTDDPEDKRVDLPTELNKSVKGDYDVVAFTHADEDHVNGFSKYFYLQHDSKYQDEGRKKIVDLWVPAAVLLQSDSEIEHEDGKILKKEARHRLKNKSGIKVFSKPNKLKDWLKKEGINFSEVEHLIVDAGKIIPDWSLDNEGIEFFVLSPFAAHVDNKDIERNEACLILHATFKNKVNTKLIFGADGNSELWNDIIDI